MKVTEMTEIRYETYVPAGFEGQPVDEIDALKRGRAVLVEEEHRWTRSCWFDNEHPEVDPQDPYCNSWKVCAEGAVLIVTVGLHNHAGVTGETWSPFPEGEGDNPELWGSQDLHQRELYDNAIELLRQAAPDAFNWGSSDPSLSANYYNDFVCKTRDEAIAWFDKTIEKAENDG